jgi:hypothetical protein
MCAFAIPRSHHERVPIDSPLRFDEAGIVFARVGSTVITACDLAIARAQRATRVFVIAAKVRSAQRAEGVLRAP